MADSAAEYFDASDDILCGSSSEVSDESGLSDGSTTNSEPEEGHGGCSVVECVLHKKMLLSVPHQIWPFVTVTDSKVSDARILQSIKCATNNIVP